MRRRNIVAESYKEIRAVLHLPAFDPDNLPVIECKECRVTFKNYHGLKVHNGKKHVNFD